MADRNFKFSDNAPGRFFVDQECIYCGLCSQIASDYFSHSAEMDHDICYNQPITEEGISLCIEAMESCPVEAIGDEEKIDQ